MNESSTSFAASQNGCKVCAPLGACLAIRGIEGAVPFLHGSQGCATYIRRYMISHFKEPMDIASSSFNEETAVFGGERNLLMGLNNVYQKYHPKLIGIATTCLAETMGEDVGLYLSNRKQNFANGDNVKTFHVSTPAYAGTHAEGFWETVRTLAATFARGDGQRGKHINVIPGILSPEDYRYLQEILDDFLADGHLIPDYSDTLDGPIWDTYHPIPEGGTPFEQLEEMGNAALTIEFTNMLASNKSPARYLETKFGVPGYGIDLPIGVRATDRFVAHITEATGKPCPKQHFAERLRLIDAYVDGHKYVSGATAVVYGEQDLVVGLSGFLAEIGIRPVICASGAKTGKLQSALKRVIEDDRFLPEVIREEVDFVRIEQVAEQLGPDLIIGNSKGFGMSKRLGIPLIRVGFPIHDRFGGQRVLHVGYRGAAQLFDRIVNALIAVRQKNNSVGYTYM